MIDVGRHIEYLLSCNDCVVVPGLGAFVACRRDASYDSEPGNYTPPMREIIFNPDISHDDGLLADSLMRAHGLTRQAAMAEIARWRGEKQIHAGRVGTLTTGADVSSPVFTPGPGGIACLWNQSLPQVKAADLSVSRAGAMQGYGDEKTLKLPSWSRYAAMIAIAVGLFVAAFTMPRLDTSHVQEACMSLFTPKAAVEQPLVPDDIVAKPIDLVIGKPGEPGTTVDITPRLETMPYVVVVASFYTRAEAMKHIAQSHDPSMRYLGVGKYHRVVVAGSWSYVKAYRMALKLDKRYPGAWALKNS